MVRLCVYQCVCVCVCVCGCGCVSVYVSTGGGARVTESAETPRDHRPGVQQGDCWSGGCGQAVTQMCCHIANVSNPLGR